MNSTSLTITTEKGVLELINSVEEIELGSSMYENPGTCKFTVLGSYDFPRGSLIKLTYKEYKLFYGYVFEISRNEENKTDVVAYDQLRYFKNQETLFLEGKTASQLFAQLCDLYQFNYKIVNPSSWKCLPYLFEKKTLFEILKHALDETVRGEKNRYIIRDNFGVLEFVDVAKNKTNLEIGTGSLLTSYTYTKSIDQDTYNAIKLIRDDKENENAEKIAYIEENDSVRKWGKLLMVEDVDENANIEQVKELANNILKVKNRETQELSLSILGVYPLKAGDGVKINIDNIINEWFFLESVTTKINNTGFTMDLEIFLIQ